MSHPSEPGPSHPFTEEVLDNESTSPLGPRKSSANSDHDRDTANQSADAEPHPVETTPKNGLTALYRRYNPQLVFENRGNTARDHLASERTFLAYVRTSLALASAGVALVQLFTIAERNETGNRDPNKSIATYARPLGIATVVSALFILGIAAYRFFLIQVSLPGNKFPVARVSIIFITFVLSALVTCIFSVILKRK